MPLTRTRIVWGELAVGLLFCAAAHSLGGAMVQSASLSAQVGVSGAGGSFNPSFSADGRSIVFVSQARNLVTNDDLGLTLGVFVHDLASGRTILGSAAVSGLSSSPAGSSDTPLISADGRWLFFVSDALDLVPPPSPLGLNIYARDLQSNQTSVVTVDPKGNIASVDPGAYSRLLSITPEGQRVAFISTITNLVEPATTGQYELFVRDMAAGVTSWASSNAASYFGTNAYRCLNGVLSGDGRFIAFKATSFLPALPDVSHALGPVLLFRHELATGITTLIASNVTDLAPPQMSTDGRSVAYDDGANVYVWDAPSASNILVSASLNGLPGEGASRNPALTPDGRFVAFVSSATGLVTNQVNGKFQVYVRDRVAGSTRLVTVNRHGLASTASHEFIEPAWSADGRQVAFESEDDELVAGDFNRASDVFLRDLAFETTRLVSVRHPALPALTGTGHCFVPGGKCLSADGRFLAFSGYDSSLVPGDDNGRPDVFLRDLFTGSTRLVTLGTNPVVNPILSANGRYLLVTEPASLFQTDSGGVIYRVDLSDGSSAVVNARWDGSGPSDQPAEAAEISGDGRLVLYTSAASDLVNLSNATAKNIFMRDMLLGTNILISVDTSGGYSSGRSYAPMLSPDGLKVAFLSEDYNLVPPPASRVSPPFLYVRDLSKNITIGFKDYGAMATPFAFSDNSTFLASQSYFGVVLHDLASQTSLVVDTNASNPSLDFRGRFLAYETHAWAGGSFARYVTNQIMVWDRLVGQSNLISVSLAGGPSGGPELSVGSTRPLITPDGRYVIFASRAPDLVVNDTNGVTDLFVYDLLLSNTVMITRSLRTGGAGNAATAPFDTIFTSKPTPSYQLGQDGRTLVFLSHASDLVEGDFNDKQDVFLLRLGLPDADGDGMDDDWEMAFFNTLARDGTADFDGDGSTDLDEFRAGTDPTNQGSVLRAMTLTPWAGGATTVLWPAVPGRAYQVQWKDDLSQGSWQTLPGAVTISGSTGSMVDTAASAQSKRFYRVVVLP
jgi:Tol biopolymer transport system component